MNTDRVVHNKRYLIREIHSKRHTDRQIHSKRHTDTEIHSKRYTDRQIHSKRHTDTEIHSKRYTDRQIHSKRHTDIEILRYLRGTPTNRETKTNVDSDVHRQLETLTEQAKKLRSCKEMCTSSGTLAASL